MVQIVDWFLAILHQLEVPLSIINLVMFLPYKMGIMQQISMHAHVYMRIYVILRNYIVMFHFINGLFTSEGDF